MSQQQQHDRRIDYVEFGAPDLDQIKNFYSAVFGWKFTDWGQEYVSFEDGRLSGGFTKREKVSQGGPLIVLYASDLEAIQNEVASHGGTIVEETYEFPGGRRFHFADPAGNLLAVWSEPKA